MTDKERIENLEKEIVLLKEIISTKKLVNNWAELSRTIEEQLHIAFDSTRMTPQIAQCKSAISCLVGKSFCKNTVLALSKEEAEEAEQFVNYILNFIKKSRKKYGLQNPVIGYERESK